MAGRVAALPAGQGSRKGRGARAEGRRLLGVGVRRPAGSRLATGRRGDLGRALSDLGIWVGWWQKSPTQKQQPGPEELSLLEYGHSGYQRQGLSSWVCKSSAHYATGLPPRSQGTQSNCGILQSPQELHSRHSKPPPPPNQAQIATPLPGSEGLTAGADAGGCVWAAACCKIKALRAKTNTYIKTPVRGEEPVFMVTGRREDVATARREIISAAEHFSMIRASRNKSGAAFGVAPALPGQVTIRVRVPYRVVGLVVGPKGATIKRIQQQTNTYIITPSRDRDPVFEITGAPGNVERAREEIETHIAVRTGKILEYNNENDFLAGSPDAALDSRYSDAWRVHPPGCKPLSTFRQNSLGCIGECGVDSGFEAPRLGEQGGDFGYGGYLFPGYGVGKQDVYYGVAETSPPLWAGQENATPTSVLFSSASSSSSSSAKARSGPPGAHRPPATSAGPELAGLPRRPPGEPLQGFSKLGGGGLRSPSGGRDCMVCFESEVTAALVPCGHNLFCMECAVRICERTDPECPVCHITATQAIRIFS
ncbi:hypothetical protein H8958_020608 [Nasalis larvatus]